MKTFITNSDNVRGQKLRRNQWLFLHCSYLHEHLAEAHDGMGLGPHCLFAHHLKTVRLMWLIRVTPWCAHAHVETYEIRIAETYFMIQIVQKYELLIVQILIIKLLLKHLPHPKHTTFIMNNHCNFCCHHIAVINIHHYNHHQYLCRLVCLISAWITLSVIPLNA
jgi:hypothetical protein